jgi:hypothetical protein
MSIESAAAAGRLVVGVLFGANAVVYAATQSNWATAGIAFSLLAATAGYFAASSAAFGEHASAQRVLLGSIAFSVLSGICFLIGA